MSRTPTLFSISYIKSRTSYGLARSGLRHGAFNAGLNMVFSDGATWMVRFPRARMVSEVTNTPTRSGHGVDRPEAHRQQDHDSCPESPCQSRLLWGPFMVTDFISGLSLSDLQKDPNADAWDCEDDKPPKINARYSKYLEIFTRILEEEVAEVPGYEERELSSLVKWSQTCSRTCSFHWFQRSSQLSLYAAAPTLRH
ncbi:hypothetical protein PABG_12393 [Paracoccidioides brasiliensis Pb03]|nr:hypothetical protein PABG_12393 [Paracoccidioides brasiliensis Pb03]